MMDENNFIIIACRDQVISLIEFFVFDIQSLFEKKALSI
jgi:hypothetical protein